MHQQSPMNQARRCHARSKRSGKPCQAPAVKGWAVCRMHGAGGGAPLGNKNALKHGLYAAETIAERQTIRALLRESGELLERAREGQFRRRGGRARPCYPCAAAARLARSTRVSTLKTASAKHP